MANCQLEAHIPSVEHDVTKTCHVVLKTFHTQDLEARLKSDTLLTYAVENLRFHVYQLPRRMDYRGYRKVGLPCEKEALDCYPLFRGWWLNLACHHGDAVVVQALLQYGADPNGVNILKPLSIPHVYYTPMTCAIYARRRYHGIFQLLLDHGAVVPKLEQDILDRVYPRVTRKSRLRRNGSKLISGHLAFGLLTRVLFAVSVLLGLIVLASLLEDWTGITGLIQPVLLVFALLLLLLSPL